MAQFKDVFSTTLKVFLALLIISAVIGVAGLILGGLGSAVNSPSVSTKTETDTHQTDADALRTTMPKKTWDRGVGKAVKKHCFTEGMNKEEMVQALGEPTKKEDYAYSGESTWTWQLPSGKCLKYDGNKCIEQEERRKTIYFTTKGNVYLQGSSCQTLNDDYVYLDSRELFKKAEKHGTVTVSAPKVESEN